MVVDGHRRRLRHEPFRPSRDLARTTIPPEVISWLARRHRQTVAGGKWPFGLRASKATEHEHVIDVDEGKGRDALDDVAHQNGQLLGVVDHESAAAIRCSTTARPHSDPQPRSSTNPRGQLV